MSLTIEMLQARKADKGTGNALKSQLEDTPTPYLDES